MKKVFALLFFVLGLQCISNAHPGHLSYEYSPIHYYLSPDHGLIFTLLVVAGFLLLYGFRHELANRL